MNIKTLSKRYVEEKKHFLGDGMQQVLKAELMACILRRHEREKKTGKEVSIVRSSAAEYLTFVAAVGKSETSVEMRYEYENIWLTQKK